MNSEWDESYFDAAQEDASIYWVCFWTGDDLQMSAQHDPQRVTAAASVEEVVAWIHQTKGDRRYELFVETHETVQSRSTGWTIQPKLVRLAGDFRPRGTVYTITASSTDVQADPREQ